jgi:hypothetical protein
MDHRYALPGDSDEHDPVLAAEFFWRPGAIVAVNTNIRVFLAEEELEFMEGIYPMVDWTGRD